MAVARTDHKLNNDYRQQGFSMIELLVTMLLLSVGMLGLMHYQQWLIASEQRLTYQQQLWQVARQAWELARLDISEHAMTKALALPPAWQLTLLSQPEKTCKIIKITVSTPKKKFWPTSTTQVQRRVCPENY